MLNVTPLEGQADCHLLEFADGSHVLIDPAEAWDAPGTALAQLKKRGITHLDLVIISHFHRDHYGCLINFLDAGIKIDRMVLNVPVKSAADIEVPWGCDLNHVQSVLAQLRARRIPYVTPKAGTRIWEVTNSDKVISGIDVLCLFDGVHSPIGQTAVNDTSIILRLFHGSTRVLFTGDMGPVLEAYLAKSDIDLKADLLKAPHHGADGVALDEFYSRIGATAVLVPSPKRLWESVRCLSIRNYLIEHHISTYVSGLCGNVTATLTAQGYSIETEY